MGRVDFVFSASRWVLYLPWTGVRRQTSGAHL